MAAPLLAPHTGKLIVPDTHVPDAPTLGREEAEKIMKPLAATMAGASMLAIECRQSSLDMRLATGYLDEQAPTLDAALAAIEAACRSGKARSIGLCANAAEVLPELHKLDARLHPAALPEPHAAVGG